MVQGSLRPGWDWLVSRKLSSLWREIDGSGLESGIVRFCDTAVEVGVQRDLGKDGRVTVDRPAAVERRPANRSSRPIDELRGL